jgi:two-component system cell cycle sensor histidine kinase/response regulator CckA
MFVTNTAGEEKMSGTSRKGKILVMDDEEMIRNFFDQLLVRLGYEVEFTKEGSEAVASYKDAMKSGKSFDAVIFDLNIKDGFGGKEAIQKLIEIDPEIIGIVSSGDFADPVMSDFGAYGFRGRLTKPYTMKEVSGTLNKVIRGV